MGNESIEVIVPGKLFIAGEYAILEHGQHAVVVAVNRYMKGRIVRSAENRLDLPQLGFSNVAWQEKSGDIQFNVPPAKLKFIKEAILLTHWLVCEQKKEPRPFSLTITSELDDGRGKKYGLGSSAAVVVTVISALLSFYDLPEIQPTKENIFKLSALAHYRAQGSGSCADIAASTYGGWLEYKMFRPEWLIGKLESGTKVIDLLKMDWPELIIRPLSPPDGLSIAVGWTKKAVSTAPMVKSIQRLRDTNLYEQFLMKSNQAVGKLIQSFEENDCDAALHALTENRYALRFLSEQATVAIETPELKTLIQIANKYGSGKSSGAGGGDCGIAFLKSNDAKTRLIQEWRDAGIDPLQLHVSETGVVINKY